VIDDKPRDQDYEARGNEIMQTKPDFRFLLESGHRQVTRLIAIHLSACSDGKHAQDEQCRTSWSTLQPAQNTGEYWDIVGVGYIVVDKFRVARND
jgi:hypothetical protein